MYLTHSDNIILSGIIRSIHVNRPCTDGQKPLSGKLSIAWHKKTVPRLGLQDPVQLEPEYLRLISLNVGKPMINHPFGNCL